MIQIGTFELNCPICDLLIPVPLVVNPAPITREDPHSVSLSANMDVSLYEVHLESHEGEEVFDG